MSREQEDKIIRQAQDILERRMAVEKEIKVNFQNVVFASAYYQGFLRGLMRAKAYFEKPVKGEDRIYELAELKLYTSSLRNAELYAEDTPIRYRNWEKDKKGRLIKCEAYFVEYKTSVVEVK